MINKVKNILVMKVFLYKIKIKLKKKDILQLINNILIILKI